MISAAVVLAFAPPQTVYTTVEGAAVSAPMWSLAGAADPHAPHVLSFFLKQRNTAALKAALDGVSDPASPDYGKHWSRAAVTALVRPSHAAIDAVVAWLAAEGLRGELSPTGEVLHVRCTLGRAASLLRAPAYERHCTAAGRSCAVRTAGPYSLPATIAPLVDFVGGTIRLPPVRAPAPATPAGALPSDPPPSSWPHPDDSFDAAALLAFSNASGAPPIAHNETANVAIAGFLNERIDPKSVHLYQQWNGLGVHGPETLHQDPGNEGSEAALDVEMVYAITKSTANLSYAVQLWRNSAQLF